MRYFCYSIYIYSTVQIIISYVRQHRIFFFFFSLLNRKLDSIWFGGAHQIKQQAYKGALELAGVTG